MTAPIDVFVTAAGDEVATARMLEHAITADGMACVVDTGTGAVTTTVEALERCRAVVFVSSPAANTAAHVVRALERASGRGVPVITFEAAPAVPSASIAYFVGTAAPIRGSGADPAGAIAALIAACRDAQRSAPRVARGPAPRPAFSRPEFADPTRLLAVLATALGLSCVAVAYAIVLDVRNIADAAARAAAGEAAVPVDPVGAPFLAPSATLWAILVGSILVLRRARLNLIARFAQNVTVGAGEIVWRAVMPFANVIWLPRMARDLRNAASAPDRAADGRWPLATLWGCALTLVYALALVRDFLNRTDPEHPAPVAALGIALEIVCLPLAGLTYAVWHAVAGSGRRAGVDVATPVEARVAVAPSAIPVDVLLLNEPEDAPLARLIAARFDGVGGRCWTCDGEPRELAFDGFQAIVVIVSTASHASPRIASLVQSAIAAGRKVVPVVFEAPPAGSPLGHYVRALHWLEAAALLVPGQEAMFASVCAPGSTATPPVDRRVFTLLAPGPVETGGYRPSALLRWSAWGAACMQVVAAAGVALLALVIAILPEGAGDPSGNLSILLFGSSLPAWALFLAWLSRAQRNARALFVSGIVSQASLVSSVGLPIVSTLVGGRTLASLFASILGRAEDPVRRRAARLQWTWTVAGLVITAGALVGWYLLAFHRLVSVAMVLSLLQAIATMSRGLVRVRMIGAVSEQLDRRARVRTPSPRLRGPQATDADRPERHASVAMPSSSVPRESAESHPYRG